MHEWTGPFPAAGYYCPRCMQNWWGPVGKKPAPDQKVGFYGYSCDEAIAAKIMES